MLPNNRKVQLVDDFNFFKNVAMPDLVHVHSLWSPISHAGVNFARRHNIPYVISTHGMLAPWALEHKWLKKKIAWCLYLAGLFVFGESFCDKVILLLKKNLGYTPQL